MCDVSKYDWILPFTVLLLAASVTFFWSACKTMNRYGNAGWPYRYIPGTGLMIGAVILFCLAFLLELVRHNL